MATPDNEIIVEDPDAPSDDSPAVANVRTVELVTLSALLAVAGLLAFDNWRTGMGWASDGPKPGYFPFYLSVVLAGACIFGLLRTVFTHAHESETFVNRDQLRRVMQVFVPTLAYCLLTQWLGLYVASFLLIAGFMWWIGKIAAWKSLLTGFLFSVIMFVTFDIAFDVIMPKGPLEALFGF